MFKNLQDWIISSEASSKEERSTIIESIGKLISEEASRVDSSESKCVASHFFMI